MGALETLADLDSIGMHQMARCKALDTEIEDARDDTTRENLKAKKAKELAHLRSTLAQMAAEFDALGVHV